MFTQSKYQLVVVAPVHDDAAAATQLLPHLWRALADPDVALRVLFVDDGSPALLANQLREQPHPAGLRVEVLRLRRNVGHQRAIALGVAFVHEHIPCDALLVMDADGEDRPEDAARLLARCRAQGGERIVFAERTRRSESALFQFLYRLYQLLHWILTGVRVRVGNFSVVPAGLLPALVTLPALWNHYAAAIFQARLPRESIPTVRDRRYSGRSKMNFVSLVVHGLQAISVFIDVVTVRLLLSVCGLAVGCGVVLVWSVAACFFGSGALSVWTPLVSGGLLSLSLALAFGCFALALGSLAKRNNFDFIPVRDYRFFVEAIQPVSPADETPAEGKVVSLQPEPEFIPPAVAGPGS